MHPCKLEKWNLESQFLFGSYTWSLCFRITQNMYYSSAKSLNNVVIRLILSTNSIYVTYEHAEIGLHCTHRLAFAHSQIFHIYLFLHIYIGDLTEKRSWFKQPVKISKFYISLFKGVLQLTFYICKSKMLMVQYIQPTVNPSHWPSC